MPTEVRLLAAELHCPPELRVHTAVSGLIDSLSALYLVIERPGGWRGVGEVRANIEYLSGIPAAAVAPAIRALVQTRPWGVGIDGAAPALARAAVESALLDGEARAAGQSAAAMMGGTARPGVATNQCLFWGPDAQFEMLAARYLAEGFTELKVRIGIAGFGADLVRLERLRELCGPGVAVAVDANGAWTGDEAVERLRQLERFGLAYVEQPTMPGDWGAFRQAVAASAVPLMLDEGLASFGDVEMLGAMAAGAGDGALLAHLKIAKFGGPREVVRAARWLGDAGIGVMVGQMNEGAMATAMAAHCAMAVAPRHAELYGCYGLLDDPATGVGYAGGQARVAPGPGHGATLDEARCRVVWHDRFN